MLNITPDVYAVVLYFAAAAESAAMVRVSCRYMILPVVRDGVRHYRVARCATTFVFISRVFFLRRHLLFFERAAGIEPESLTTLRATEPPCAARDVTALLPAIMSVAFRAADIRPHVRSSSFASRAWPPFIIAPPSFLPPLSFHLPPTPTIIKVISSSRSHASRPPYFASTGLGTTQQ